MSQHGFTDLSAGARSGGDLTALFEAIQSGHIGTARPSYAVKGMLWAKDIPASDLVEIYLYDGSGDALIGSVDTTTSHFVPAGQTGAPILNDSPSTIPVGAYVIAYAPSLTNAQSTLLTTFSAAADSFTIYDTSTGTYLALTINYGTWIFLGRSYGASGVLLQRVT